LNLRNVNPCSCVERPFSTPACLPMMTPFAPPKLRPIVESITSLLSSTPVFCYNSPPCSVSLDCVTERW
jgi:hypothetical protein